MRHRYVGKQGSKSIYLRGHRTGITLEGLTYFRLLKCSYMYSKICLKRLLKIDKTKALKINCSLIKVESMAECSLGAFCNTRTCIKRKSV